MATTPQDFALKQINALKKQWKSNRKERAEARQLHRMAEGDWADLIPAMPAEPEHHASKRPKFAPNILGQALRALDTLYSEEPHRSLDDEAAQEWADDKLWSFGIGLSVAMERADTLTTLLGTTILYPAYKTAPDGARTLRHAIVNGESSVVGGDDDGIEVLCLPRYQFELLGNEMDPRHVEAAVICIGSTSKDTNGVSAKVEIHHYWDRDCFALLHDFVPQPIGEDGSTIQLHGLPDHPITTCRNDESKLSTYAEGFGGEDLKKNVLAVGSMWREYSWTAKLQRGQPWVVGKNTNMVLAPDAFWQLEQGGLSGIHPGNANLDGMLDATNTMLDVWSRSIGLPSRTFAMREQVGAMSGVAMAIDRAEITDHRNRRQKLTRAWERSITRKAAWLYGAVRGVEIPIRLDVTYRPLPTILTFDEKRQRLEFQADREWISPADALREMYPDISDHEIEERLERAKEYYDEQRANAREDARAGAMDQADAQVTVANATRAPDPFASLGL